MISSRSRFACLSIALLGILVLTTSAALGAVPAQRSQSEPGMLVRIDIESPGELERFAALGLPVYAHLFSRSGQEYLLLPVNALQRATLSGVGYKLEELDSGSSSASYFLLFTHNPDLFQQAVQRAVILEQDGPNALVRGLPEEIEPLAALGIEISLLQLHPLVIPGSRSVAWSEAIDPDPTIQGMVDQVSLSSVYEYDAGLSGEFPVTIGGQPYTILTRNSRTVEPIQKATQYAYEHFSSLGLDVTYHEYFLPNPNGGMKRNVVAKQPGLSQPENILLITAHLDSTSSDYYNYAPGADDNASGSVGVLIAADILSQYSFDCTLRYVLFTGEEQGLLGSDAYAQFAYDSGDNILGVLNLDMIGYNSDSFPDIELHTRSGSPEDLTIANLFADVVDAYNLNLTPQFVQDGISASDHYSFWQRGYPGILAIEDFEDFTPHYHSNYDQVETLDLTYFTDFVKAAVATFAHMGCPLGTLSGQVIDTETSTPIQGTTIAAEDLSGKQHFNETDTSGTYRHPLVIGTYTVTAIKDGYLPFSISGIDITMDMTNTLDIQLEPCHILKADFSYAPAQPLSGKQVVFTGTVGITSTTPVSYTWDFGDGHTGSGQVATHTYTVSDTYSVSMSAENCAGMVNATHPVTVTGTPGLNVSMESMEVEALFGQTVTRTLEIGNSGVKPLSWNLMEQPEVPWMDEWPPSGMLDPQEREQINLTVKAPFAHSTYTTTLMVASNDPDQQQLEIAITLVPVSPYTTFLPVVQAGLR